MVLNKENEIIRKRNNKMKIAVTSQGAFLESQVDQRFGRAKYFIIYDTENKTFTVNENIQNLNAVQGAGIQSAQKIVESGVEILITGHCGPKAFTVLNAGKIKVSVGASGKVKDAISDFENNRLTFTDSADVQGHWS